MEVKKKKFQTVLSTVQGRRRWTTFVSGYGEQKIMCVWRGILPLVA